MRSWLCALMLAATLKPVLAGAEVPDMIGRYAVAEGPDVAGQLVLSRDGRFQYALAAGALDERAQGRWEKWDAAICLFTSPKTVAPVFSKLPSTGNDEAATLLVVWPDGNGIAGVDFQIGFDSGEPLEGYTQYYGWSLPDGDSRVPRWVELSVPMHQLRSQRIMLDAQDRGRLRVMLTPNDLGVVDFEGACLEQKGKDIVLHRKEGDMHFVRSGD